MRGILLPLLLLHATAVFAQPIVSSEVVSDPLQYQATPASYAVPAVAMARDRTGVVIAWVMQSPLDFVDRIFLARLDATLHIAGPVRSIPSSLPGGTVPGDTIEESDPSLARDPSGDGFTLAWMERSRRDSRVVGAVYCRLDVDFKPSAPSILPVRLDAIGSPAIVRSGKSTWIAAGTYAWKLQADGSVTGPLDAGLPASDMALATDFPQLISGRMVITSRTCAASLNATPLLCQIVNHYSYQVQFVSLYTLSTSKTFSFESTAEPAIQSDGHDVMIAWFRGTEASGGEVVAGRLSLPTFADFSQAVEEPRVLSTFAPDLGGPTRPDIATDGERYVIVWRTISPERTYDIVGASIDRAGNVTPLSIATSGDDERDPSVIALGEGRFLVAYEKVSTVDRRIAGRFVTFESRVRAVR
jgi:hypothetical protein